MQNAFDHCQALVREADKDRFLASLFAPADRRPDLFALYAFNVEIVRVREVVSEALTGEIRLQWWRDALTGKVHGDVAAHPVAAALLRTMDKHRLPVEPLLALIDAHSGDLYDDPMFTLHDFDNYALKTSSGLIELAAHILVGADAHCSACAGPAGIAQAVTVLLASLPSALARRNLPLDVLERHGVRREEVMAGQGAPGFAAALADLRAYARVQLAAAAAAWNTVPREARAAFLPVALIAPLLRRMDSARDNPFAAVNLPQWRRQLVMWWAAYRGIF